jgi:hypothetical protein
MLLVIIAVHIVLPESLALPKVSSVSERDARMESNCCGC